MIDQLEAPADRLPCEGTVLSVTVSVSEFVGADHREDESGERREAIEKRFDRLSEHLSDH